MTEEIQKKTSRLWIYIIVTFLLTLGLCYTGYYCYSKYNNDTYQAYQDGATYGIQYRNSLIIADLEKQGYTQMNVIDANNQSQVLILIPYNPNQGNQTQ